MTSAPLHASASTLWRDRIALMVPRSGLRDVSQRRKLQIMLGLLWLVDGSLQYQPYMFSRSFVTNTIEPTAAGAPSFVAQPTLGAAHLMIHHIALYNVFFATIQVVIALAIFSRPFTKVGLALSIVWSLGVWWLAEGIGGVTNGASPLSGAPGAVILYAFLALLLWPATNWAHRPSGTRDRSVAEGGPFGAVVPKLAWALLWLSFAQQLLISDNRAPSALHHLVVGNEDGEPAFVQALDRFLAGPLAHHGTEFSIVLAVLCALVAVGVLLPATARPAIAAAVAFGVAVWLVEDFGGIFTSHGTDVNSGPLLVLLAAAYWPLRGCAGLRAVLASEAVLAEGPHVEPPCPPALRQEGQGA
ncbi:MAG: hypothetical protein ACR2MN_16865 [Acidimicrobiales bacterium]